MDFPVLTWLPSGRKGMWRLEEDWSHPVNGSLLTVREGFIFDIASIPRFLWWLPGYAPMELGIAGPLVHDYLYAYKGVPPVPSISPEYRTFKRREADRYLRDLMAEAGVKNPRRFVAWLAVRLGGWVGWRKGQPAS